VQCGILLSLEPKQFKKSVLKHLNKTYSIKNRNEILENVVSCISLSLVPLTANYWTLIQIQMKQNTDITD